MIYGVRAPRSATHEAKVFTQVQLDFMYVMEMGKLPPVDLFPILRWVPEKLAPWKRKVLSVKSRQEGLFSELLSRVVRRISQGKQNGAFMEEAYNRRSEWGLSDLMLMCVIITFLFVCCSPHICVGTWVALYWKALTPLQDFSRGSYYFLSLTLKFRRRHRMRLIG